MFSRTDAQASRNKRIGKRLKDARDRIPVTQEQVAQALKMQRVTILRREAGQLKTWSPSQLEAHLDALVELGLGNEEATEIFAFAFPGRQRTRQPEINVATQRTTSLSDEILEVLERDRRQREAKIKLYSLMDGPKKAEQLHGLLLDQKYNYETIGLIETLIVRNPDRTKILASMVELLVAALGPADISVLGMCANTLSRAVAAELEIAPAQLGKLTALLAEKKDDVTWTGVTEPLAFMLTVHGREDALREQIKQMLTDSKSRNADLQRIGGYYGDHERRLAGLIRHFQEPRRREKDLLVLNDTHRLLDIAKAASKDQSLSPLKGPSLRLVRECIKRLKSVGMNELAEFVAAELADADKG